MPPRLRFTLRPLNCAAKVNATDLGFSCGERLDSDQLVKNAALERAPAVRGVARGAITFEGDEVDPTVIEELAHTELRI